MDSSSNSGSASSPQNFPTQEYPSSVTEQDILWNSAGMHRPIASFWYNYIFILLLALPAILVVGYLIPSVILPYPSALGIATVVTNFFQLMFILFDVGTGLAIERFIAEHAIKNPKRALQYLQFFTWFQLFTGLIQTSIVAIYVLYTIRLGSNAFLAWPFLMYSLTQYPGMLGVYKHALAAFQRHDKAIIVELFQNVLFQSLTQIIFILIGRSYGASHPAVGEILGGAIGYIIGSYIDDFIGMVLAGYFFRSIIMPLGYTLQDTIKPNFDRELVKEVFIYGLKVLPAYAIEAGVQFLILLMTMQWLPNFTDIVAIVSLADGVAMITSVSFSITPAISEAYNNGYYHLTQYYIKQQWKHWGLIASFLFVCVLVVIPPAFRALAGNYSMAADLLPILLITRLLVFPINFGSAISQGINKPEYQTYALFFEQSAMAASFYILLNPGWGVITILGADYGLILYVFAKFPAFCVKLVTQWWFVKRTIKFSISPPFFQTFVAPILAAIPIYLLLSIPIAIFNRVVAASGGNLLMPIVILAITLLVALFVFPMLVLFPFYGLFGGWDDAGLEAFVKASKICGPSGKLVKIMAKLTTLTHKISPLANKFPIDHTKAIPEEKILSEQRIALFLADKLGKK